MKYKTEKIVLSVLQKLVDSCRNDTFYDFYNDLREEIAQYESEIYKVNKSEAKK